MGRDDDNGFGDWGGYFEAKKSKLEEQFAAASDPFRKSNIFDGISIFVNGRTNPSADELKRIMMVHGGIFHHYERSHTNFIIASNLPDVKVRKMDTSKIISAQWVVDCVSESRVLDYKPYLLYTNQKTTQPRINFSKGKNNNSTATDMDMDETERLSKELGGVLKELQQAVATSPDKNTTNISNNNSITNISATTNPGRALTAVDPAFLGEFYKNSRLHHIATLGAGFKQYVCDLRQSHANKSFEKREAMRSFLMKKPKPLMPTTVKRRVMHIDMDCFFVSVGLVNHPELRGLPVAVTHSKGGSGASDVPVHPQANRQVEQELFAQRFEQHLHNNVLADKVRGGFDKKMSLSEIASCSYEARAKGIRNGMFVGQALKLCPDLKTIPYDFEHYRQVAFALYDIVASYTLNIEAVSCDEMFVDLTDLLQDLQVDAMTFVSLLRQEVREATKCPCSAGVGDNKLMARLATKVAKPNGQHLLETEDAANYMASLDIDVLPGVGSSTTYRLNQAGMKTCGDVQQASLVSLEMLLGKKMAQTLYQNCRGLDPRPLIYEQQRKSVSAEVNYGIRFTKNEDLETFLQQLSVEVHTRLTEIKRKAKSITLKLMVRAAEAPVETSKFMGHGVCDNQTKSVLLKQSTNDVQVITSNVLRMMKESGYPPHELRGIGIHLSKLDDVVESKKENVIKNMFVKMSEKQKTKPVDVSIAKVKEPEVEIPKNSGKVNVLTMLMTAAANRQRKGFEQLPTGNTRISMRNDLFEENIEEEKKQQLDDSPKKAIDLQFKPARTSMQAKIEQFDPEVLAQLPEDLRREILSFPDEYLPSAKVNTELSSHVSRRKSPLKTRRMRSISRSPSPQEFLPSTPPNSPPLPGWRRSLSPSTSPLSVSDLQPSTSKVALERQLKRAACRSDQIVVDYVKKLPNHMHPQILQYLKNTKTIPEGIIEPAEPAAKEVAKVASPTQLVGQNDGVDPEFKKMIITWVKTEDTPQPADVNLMFMSFCYLVDDNKIDEVYELMKFLCRLIKSKRGNNCRWHMAYNEIESNVQEKVYEVLDYHIYFTEVIGCCKCS
ncbi:DNA repair protein Rev1 [Drosophila albomicans]|uniref:DNA repair protein REV1 n=1 Tax=Drosophila albomicans TaxID=7291 RepID=A0A6P8WPP2_DROAB|nr:DNA repair protein Rev1 [Drosophila albomicans]